jgi:hypothetical protein
LFNMGHIKTMWKNNNISNGKNALFASAEYYKNINMLSIKHKKYLKI